MKLKLHQFLRRAGIAEKKEDIYKLISSGRVKVGASAVTAASYIFDPKKKMVFVDGRPVRIKKKLYLLVDKPVGISCQKGESPNIYDWLKKNYPLGSDELKTLFTVGRLDKETEGLIIVTNDGGFANRISQPEEKVEKEYEAVVKGNVTGEEIKKLEEGLCISIEGKRFKTLPAKVKVIKRGKFTSRLSITIVEGKKRQIRLMMMEVGHPVLRLKRIRIGGITLKHLGHKKVAEVDLGFPIRGAL